MSLHASTIVDALTALTCELRENRLATIALMQWLKQNQHAATKEDLRETEARIIGQGSHSNEDQKRLDAILARASDIAMWITAIAKNLAQLDASTQ